MIQSSKALVVLALLMTFATGCAQLPQTGRGPVTENSAVQSLYGQALEDKHAGRIDQAQAKLERAVRIEPSNPHLWFQLAHLANDSGATEKARGLAQRAYSLAGGDPFLSRQIDAFLDALE